MGNRFRDWLADQDFYGHPIGVNFYGSDTNKTKMGGATSICTYLIMVLNFAILAMAFIDGSR
jgi:hypothetical protein